MRKKIGCFLCCLLLAAASLQGCGSGNNNNDAEKEVESGSETETEAGQEAETASEPVTMKDDGIRWQDFVADMGMGWNLGNTFDPIDCDWVSGELDYEGAWVPGGPKTTKEMIQLVKDQGFRTIRIPVSWHNHVDITTDENGEKRYTIRKQWMERVKEVVDYCYDEGLYVVINIHHDDEDKKFIYPTEEYKEQSIGYITQIWTQVAREFADYDLHLIYEVFNEVRLVGTDDEWTPDTPAAIEAQLIMNEYSQAGVDAIRSVAEGYNESRFIMCTGYAGNLYSYEHQVLPTDKGGYPNRIMVSTHPYTPSSFCMDASENGKSVFDEQVQVSVKEVFRVINREWTSKDVPVVISEWGAILKVDNEEERIKHASYYVKQAVTACKDSAGETVQIPCVLWDNGTLGDLTKGETFGFLDRQNMRWFDQGYVDAIIEASGGEVKERTPVVEAEGQLINGNFADGITGFEVYAFNPEDISYNADAENGFSIDIANTSKEDWHIQLKQGGIRLQQGKWYQITLDAKSSLGRSILCSMQRDGTNDDNWMSYSGNKELALTKQWKTYTIIFQMTEKTDKSAIFNLAMGTVNGNRITTAHTIGIRNIKLEQLPDTWLNQLSKGDNLIKNADFSYGDILWEASVVSPGAAKTSFEGGKAVFNISKVGTIDWHVQLKQSGITLEQGNGYRLTFKASSSVPRTISVGFMDKDYVNWYGGEMVTLGAEQQTITIGFYMDKATDTDVRMFLSMGKIENTDTPASVITLSDFSLVKDPDIGPMSFYGGGGGYDGGGFDPFTYLTDGWFVYDHNDLQVSSCYVDGDNGFRMDIDNTGTEAWHIQLQKKNFLLEQGKWYRITLDAKSTLDRDIGIVLQRDGAADDNWTPYSGGDTASLTGEWQTFTKEFQMTSETDPATIYCLSLGSVDGKQITQAHTVWINHLKLEEIEEPKRGSVELNTEMLDQKAWGSNVDTSQGAAATVQYKDGTAVFDITNVGSASHHVQLSQGGLMLEKGCRYELTFRATSTAARTISVGFLGSDRGWKWYGGEDIMIFPVSAQDSGLVCLAEAYGGEDIGTSPTPPQARSAEDGLWRVEFTMNEETDANATLAISLGMIENGEIPEGQHTVMLSELSLKKIAEAGDAPDPGPEDPGSENGVIYVKATDPQETDEYGSKWIVKLDHEKYGTGIVAGESRVKVTVKLYSDKGFKGMLGACGGGEKWTWFDTGEKTEAGGESTWTLYVDSFMGAAQIQLYSMDGDCVEIRSIQMEVVPDSEVPDPEEPKPEVITIKSTDEKNTEDGSEKWVVKIDPAKYGPDIIQGESRVKITATLYSEKGFKGLLGACGEGESWSWFDTGEKTEKGGESTWTLYVDSFMGAAQIQIFSMDGDCVEIRSIKMEVVQPGTEDPGPEDGVIRVNATDAKVTDEYGSKWVVEIDPTKYCADIVPGESKVRITVDLYSEKGFKGQLGAVAKEGWPATGEKTETGGKATWELEVDKLNGNAQVQIFSMDGDWVEIRSIKAEVVQPGTEDPGPEDGVIRVNATDAKVTDEYGSKWVVEIDPTKYCADIVPGESKVRITVDLYSEKGFKGQLGAVAKEGWPATGEKMETGGKATWELEVDKLNGNAQVQIFSMDGDWVEIRSIKAEVVQPGTEDPGPEDGVIRVNATDPQKTDEYGSKWIVEIDPTKYCADIVPGESKVRITVDLYSEKGFKGQLGAVAKEGWPATGEKTETGGKATWELEVDKLNGNAQVQIFSMDGDWVEIRSIKAEVVQPGTEDPGPEDGVIRVNATDKKVDDGYGEKWIVEIDPTKYCADIVPGESKVRITVDLYSDQGFKGMLGACGEGDKWTWFDTGDKEEAGGKSTWTLDVDSFMGAAKIQLYSMVGDCVEIRSIKMEKVD